MNFLEKISKRDNNDNAVSPVVGVMLMLIVTVIIAAVVAGFGTGLIGGLETTPTISVTASISSDKNITIIVNGVDNIISEDEVKTVLTYLGTNGYYSQELFFDGPIMTSAKCTDYIRLMNGNVADSLSASVSDYRVASTNCPATTEHPNGKYAATGVTNPDVGTTNLLKSGSKLQLVMTHIPTGKAILEKDLVFVDMFQ